MKIYAKDLAPLGFKGIGMFDDSKWYHMYSLEIPSRRTFYIINVLDDSISHFTLTPKQYKLYKANKLSLIPLGCCNAGCSHLQSLENPNIDFQGNFEKVFGKKKNLLVYIEKLVKG